MFGRLFGGRGRDERTAEGLLRIAEHGRQLNHLRSALQSLGIQLPKDPLEAVAMAASALTLELAETEGMLPTANEDVAYVSSLFAFVAANRFSHYCGVSFEHSASVAVGRVLSGDPTLFAKVHADVVNDYNVMSRRRSETLAAIATVLAHWYADPSTEKLERASRLFHLSIEATGGDH